MSARIGEKLRQARQKRSLSLEEVSQVTYMRVQYLAALESGNLEALPSQAQGRGFLRAYADFLGLDGEKLLGELDQEQQQEMQAEAAVDVSSLAKRDATTEQIAAIFIGIGESLRQQREMLGLSLEDVERHTHLREQFLRQMEAGELDDLPSPVQARGMLHNYASFIGLNPEPLLLRFAEALQLRLAARQVTVERKRAQQQRVADLESSTWRRIFSGETIMTVLISIFLLGFIIWGILQIIETRKAVQTLPAPPAIADILLATATVTETPTPMPPTATVAQPPMVATQETPLVVPEITQEAGQTGAVQVYVTVRQRAWMRITVDSKVEFEGRVQPGSAYVFSGRSQVEVLTGNGAALQIFFQQQDLGPMGNLGQVVDRVYTLEGVLLPTATITPTSTETPLPSPTLKQTGTPATLFAP